MVGAGLASCWANNNLLSNAGLVGRGHIWHHLCPRGEGGRVGLIIAEEGRGSLMEIGGQSAAGHLWVPSVAGMKTGTLPEPRGCQRKRGAGVRGSGGKEVAGALSSTKVH